MKLLICIPTYNEKENILKLLERLMRFGSDIDVLVVDDNSPDGTGCLVESFSRQNSRVHLLKRKEKQGLGPAYLAAFQWGLARNYDAFLEMDADLSHRPRYIPRFLKALEHSDVVIGSRWIRGGKIVNWSMHRICLSRLANIYAKAILRISVSDLTAGFVCYRRHVLENLNLNQIHSDGYSFQIEMKYRVFLKNYRITEIPITFTDRKNGDSKISRKIVFEALMMVWLLKLGKIDGSKATLDSQNSVTVMRKS